MTQMSMFPDINDRVRVVPPGPSRARSASQALLMAVGMHPLAKLVRGLKLHPEAAPPQDRSAPGLRCGNCARTLRQGMTTRPYLKCELYPSRSEASDIRNWWPACSEFKPK